MNLDRRAAQAAHSLRASVSGVAPVSMSSVVGRQRRSLMTSFAVAAAAVMFIVGAAAAMPRLFEPDQVATNTTIPDGTPVVVEPDDKEGDGSLVDLDRDGSEVLAVRMTRSASDSPEPYTVFYGTGEPGSPVMIVSQFAEASGEVGEEGEFEIKVWFEPRPPAGEEFPITVTVDGQDYEFTFTSLYDPDNMEVTANQTYGASNAAEAYEKFFGTAPPGTEILATSPFGSADTVAGEHGRWDLKLWFEGPLPLDEPFDITLTVGGETFTFPFVSVYELPVAPLSITQVNTVSDSSSPFVQFIGTAPAGTHLLAQSEYGAHDIVVGESGEFSLKVWFSPLPPAGQQFPITFKVNWDHYDTFSFTSLYEKETGGSEGVEVDQYNTESSDASPWAKFHVFGPPGTAVQIISPYGSVTQTLENSGDYVKLWFGTLPPAGETFQLTVKIDGETHGTYDFTSWFDPENVEVSVNQYISEWPAHEGANPWVKFYGTAPIGTQIQIVSDYGSWSWTTEAIEWNSGHRYFEPLPTPGVAFDIVVKVNGETFGTYSYANYYDPENVEITATSKWGTCAEDPPYDKYYGTAPPGTEISITSPYGGGATVADGEGNWLKVVYFEGAPLDEEFAVTVTIDGEVFQFGMVVTG